MAVFRVGLTDAQQLEAAQAVGDYLGLNIHHERGWIIFFDESLRHQLIDNRQRR